MIFCFIDSSIMSVPDMEPLDAGDLSEVRRQAEALLRAHDNGYASHVFVGQKRVATIRRARDPKRGTSPNPAFAAPLQT